MLAFLLRISSAVALKPLITSTESYSSKLSAKKKKKKKKGHEKKWGWYEACQAVRIGQPIFKEICRLHKTGYHVYAKINFVANNNKNYFICILKA